MADDPLVLLSRALDQTGEVLANIRDDQLTLPTPCGSWDVRRLAAHVVTGIETFAVRASGGTPDWKSQDEDLPEDWRQEFGKRADHLLDLWRQAGDLSGTVELPGMGEVPARFPIDQQIAELAVHGWDLATATGQTGVLDPEIAEVALAFASQALRPEFRGDEASGKAIGHEVEVPADAPSYDRLVAFFGRDPRFGH
jgi:uncharacterized protein (TIGR03086 family)